MHSSRNMCQATKDLSHKSNLKIYMVKVLQKLQLKQLMVTLKPAQYTHQLKTSILSKNKNLIRKIIENFRMILIQQKSKISTTHIISTMQNFKVLKLLKREHIWTSQLSVIKVSKVPTECQQHK
jgi:hypothetical protein